MDQWLAEAKAHESAPKVGMYLTHNGTVRQSAKAKVRFGAEDTLPVTGMYFSYDAEKVNACIADTYQMEGIYYIKVWLNEGALALGDVPEPRKKIIRAFSHVERKIFYQDPIQLLLRVHPAERRGKRVGWDRGRPHVWRNGPRLTHFAELEPGPADITEDPVCRIDGVAPGTFQSIVTVKGDIRPAFLRRPPAVVLSMVFFQGAVPKLLVAGTVMRRAADRTHHHVVAILEF